MTLADWNEADLDRFIADRLERAQLNGARLLDGTVGLFKLKGRPVPQVLINTFPGPLPIGPINFTVHGGLVLAIAGGSSYSPSAAQQLEVRVQIDGSDAIFLKAFTNEANSHKALVLGFFTQILTPGVHTYKFVQQAGSSDNTDYFSLAILEAVTF